MRLDYEANLQTNRLTQRARAMTCEICYQAPAVKRVWHRDERDGTQWTANVCEYCASKVGK